MAKPEWGKKRVCQSCAAKYYDLQNDPPVCPKCGTVFQVEAPQRSRRARPVEVEKPIPVPVIAAEEEDLDVAVDGLATEEIDEEDDETLPEDASDLGEDEDVTGVIDTVDPERDET